LFSRRFKSLQLVSLSSHPGGELKDDQQGEKSAPHELSCPLVAAPPLISSHPVDVVH